MVCTKCGEEKELSEYCLRKDSGTYRRACRKCFYKITEKWRSENRDKVNEQARLRWKKNPEKARASYKKYRQSHPKQVAKYAANWRKNNRDKVNAYKKRYYTKALKTIKGRLNRRMGEGVRKALKKNKNGRHWEDLVGYTKDELRSHLENLFTEGMTWDKFLKGEIHIDHVIPLSFFKYNSTDDVEFRYCWSLHNLQPLWAEDNIRKGTKIPWKNAG